MNKQLGSLFLALALCLGLAIPARAAELSDVPADHWAYQQVSRCVQDGIVSGYPDGAFKPTNPVSYGAFSIMLARAFYASELAGYSDQGTAAGEAIMNKHGILKGTSRSSASIGASLPREDMAQVMYNILVDKGAKIPSVNEQNAAISAISDFYSISYNCRTGVLVCYTLGLLTGQNDGSFGPKNPMNRAQGCVVINRLRDYMGNTTEPPVDPVDPSEPTTPTVTELPAFKLEAGENVQQMMNRLNAATPAYTAGYLSNGKPIMEANIQEILNSARESMPEGIRWDTDSFYNYNSPKLFSGPACSSFACGLSDYIFGEDAPVTKHQNFDQLKVGDVVWMKNSTTGYSHAFVITSLTNPYYGSDYYSACDGNSGGEVSWSSQGKYTTFDKPEVASGTYIYSRY
ncbi:S-layer homology domain-containing protein [uncultured Oscillibacter sp.]|uniref:S-layer homology domain-containing protein n=1 Tax=uncultured Oscillibacter sp. TaxID=876091 RepID=UPI0026130E3A|nr:S-layer homology domain-containing protein [uncultured Oscillibacter sp.]